MLTLLAADAVNALRLTSLHERAGALSFMLIGASYLLLQFASRRPWSEKLKAIFMGIGFVFWGSASLLPPGPWVTFMDTSVVLIFVLDLSLIILENLKQNRHD
jgi:hypothetical protein